MQHEPSNKLIEWKHSRYFFTKNQISFPIHLCDLSFSFFFLSGRCLFKLHWIYEKKASIIEKITKSVISQFLNFCTFSHALNYYYTFYITATPTPFLSLGVINKIILNTIEDLPGSCLGCLHTIQWLVYKHHTKVLHSSYISPNDKNIHFKYSVWNISNLENTSSSASCILHKDSCSFWQTGKRKKNSETKNTTKKGYSNNLPIDLQTARKF